MRWMATWLAALGCLMLAAPGLASGVTWVDRPDPRDTYLPHTKDLVLEESPSLTVQLRTNRHPENTFGIGEKVRAIVAVSGDAHVYLIGIDEKWDVAQIFPGKKFKENQLRKGVEHSIPPESGARVGYYTPDCAGTQYLLAVASATAVDLTPHLALLRDKRGDFAGALASFQSGLEAASPGCAVATATLTIREASKKVVAVVMGCGAYRTQALGSTVPDAKAFGRYLEETFGAKLRMKLLCDPGRAEMEETLSRWLPAQVAPGDAVFVYYSGHGTSVKDLDGDETDGLDEALVPTDYTAAPPGDWATARRRLIVDDDLHRWVQSASDKGAAKTLLIFDACHSGTAQRGLATAEPSGAVVPKVFRGLFEVSPGAPPDAGASAVVSRAISRAGTGAAADVDPSTRWGVLAACRDSEISWAGDPLSLMTTHLLAGLAKRDGRAACDANGDGKVTIGEAAAYARERVNQYVRENHERLGKSTAGGDPTQTVTTSPAGDALTINE